MSSYDTAAMVTAAANTQKATIGAQVVSKTLDVLHKTAPTRGKGKYSAANGMAASYDFNQAVLSTVYSPKGAIANMLG